MAEEQKFENEHDAGEDHDGGGESDSDDKRKGRRKIDISFIENKSRRHITFSKRKAGIMKKVRSLPFLAFIAILRASPAGILSFIYIYSSTLILSDRAFD